MTITNVLSLTIRLRTIRLRTISLRTIRLLILFNLKILLRFRILLTKIRRIRDITIILMTSSAGGISNTNTGINTRIGTTSNTSSSFMSRITIGSNTFWRFKITTRSSNTSTSSSLNSRSTISISASSTRDARNTSNTSSKVIFIS